VFGKSYGQEGETRERVRGSWRQGRGRIQFWGEVRLLGGEKQKKGVKKKTAKKDVNQKGGTLENLSRRAMMSGEVLLRDQNIKNKEWV